ncbi:hypothetical protein GY45DRAFT_433193 [Cubamyces sp. BRFM 1775]|nr:hypothetical protein GY45DRAFT_433193 [Cubamyces sp. BRFM 1775]
MPDDPSYSRLPSSSPRCSTEAFLPLNVDDGPGHVSRANHTTRRRTSRLPFLSEAASWKLFCASCVVALALSTANLISLSTSATSSLRSPVVQPVPPLAALKKPSVYLGLDSVPVDPTYCRSRGTFPKKFYTYDADAIGDGLKHVHAPDDKMTLHFGGSVRAVVDIYIPDHGLENCTVSVRRMADDAAGIPIRATADIDVYLVSSVESPVAPGNREHRDGGASYLDTLLFAAGHESSSRAFYCPSREHIYMEWRCPAKDCEIIVALEGVTSLTASAASLSKTGFQITQYEALSCVPPKA